MSQTAPYAGKEILRSLRLFAILCLLMPAIPASANRCDDVQSEDQFFPITAPSAICANATHPTLGNSCRNLGNEILREHLSLKAFRQNGRSWVDYTSPYILRSFHELRANVAALVRQNRFSCGLSRDCVAYLQMLDNLQRYAVEKSTSGTLYDLGLALSEYALIGEQLLEATFSRGLLTPLNSLADFRNRAPFERLRVHLRITSGGIPHTILSDPNRIGISNSNYSLYLQVIETLAQFSEQLPFVHATSFALEAEDFNAVSFLPVGYVGLVQADNTPVDGQNYNPHQFTGHDLAHLRLKFKAPVQTSIEPFRSTTVQHYRRVANRLSRFRCSCQALSLIDALPSLQLKKAGHLVWFILSHEVDGPISEIVPVFPESLAELTVLLNNYRSFYSKIPVQQPGRPIDFFGTFPPDTDPATVDGYINQMLDTILPRLVELSDDCFSSQREPERQRQASVVPRNRTVDDANIVMARNIARITRTLSEALIEEMIAESVIEVVGSGSSAGLRLASVVNRYNPSSGAGQAARMGTNALRIGKAVSGLGLTIFSANAFRSASGSPENVEHYLTPAGLLRLADPDIVRFLLSQHPYMGEYLSNLARRAEAHR